MEPADRIVLAAREVLAGVGLHPWSMTMVAERAGVSRRTLYRYFPSKSDLVEALSVAAPTPAPAPVLRTVDLGTGWTGVGSGRRRLLAAARELFGRKGYDGASVREIAERAGMSKLMVYRHFGSKAALFQEATMDPIKEFIADFLDGWAAQPPRQRPVIESVRDFYAALCEVLEEQRDLLVPLLLAGSSRQGTVELNNSQYLERVFKRWFDFMDRIMLGETTGDGFRPFDQRLASRLIFGMILSVVLHDEWLLDGPRDRSHLVDEMANLTVFGIVEPAPRLMQPLR